MAKGVDPKAQTVSRLLPCEVIQVIQVINFHLSQTVFTTVGSSKVDPDSGDKNLSKPLS